MTTKKKIAALVWGFGVLILIFGCLAAIAAPKFGTFSRSGKCRTRQSEAKIFLSGLWIAEKSFFGEYGYYTTDLVALQWVPDGAPWYAYGFTNASARTSDPRLSSLDPTRRTTADPRVTDSLFTKVRMVTRATERPLAQDDFARLAPTTTATETGFLAVAIGDVDDDSGSDERLDVWTIDQDKNLVNVSNDCTD